MAVMTTRGIKTGTPVPVTSREQRQAASGVKEYTLSPEELEYYRSLPRDGRRAPIGVNIARQDEERRNERAQRGDEQVAINLTREEYLQKRLSGMSRSAVAKEQGIKPPSLYPYLERWGLREMDAEERELELMQEQRKPVPATPATDDQPIPADPQQNALPFKCSICGTAVALEGGLCSVKCEDEFTELFTSASQQSDAVQQVEHPVVDQMTREQYLTERKSGKSRAQIAKDEGIELSELDKRLRKWKLKDPIAEQRAIDSLDVLKTPESEQKTAEIAPKVDESEPGTGNQVQSVGHAAPGVDQSVDENRGDNAVQVRSTPSGYVTIRLPIIRDAKVPEHLMTQKVGRPEALELTIDAMISVIGWTLRDLEDLVGTGNMVQMVQDYLDRHVGGEAVAS